jgi:hypothetical protein
MTDRDIKRAAQELTLFLYGNVEVSPEEFEAKTSERLRAFVVRAYEEAALIADEVEKEADEAAQREGLPLDHGGDPEVARRIRALKDSLSVAATVSSL